MADWKTPDGQPVVAMINFTVKRIDHLLMEDHLAMTIPLHNQTPKGLPTDAD